MQSASVVENSKFWLSFLQKLISYFFYYIGIPITLSEHFQILENVDHILC